MPTDQLRSEYEAAMREACASNLYGAYALKEFMRDRVPQLLADRDELQSLKSNARVYYDTEWSGGAGEWLPQGCTLPTPAAAREWINSVNDTPGLWRIVRVIRIIDHREPVEEK